MCVRTVAFTYTNIRSQAAGPVWSKLPASAACCNLIRERACACGTGDLTHKTHKNATHKDLGKSTAHTTKCSRFKCIIAMGRRACVSFGLDQTIRFPRRSDVCEALQCVRVCWHTRVCMQNGLNVGMRPCYRACYDRTHFHYVQRERETE